ncbi:hypothetical protein [Salinibacter grassmerensis]|uniref:hypothetical protein n=1 Tax=Salinibacter grassmerensis TaxID=3040353 RepID=UPI0021E857AC|nr:hypothetical protein [Salinibacter grassmerensis]
MQRRMRGWTRTGPQLLLLLSLLCACARSVGAQPEPRVEVRVSADSVKVGERFTLTLAATRAADRDVTFPSVDAGPAVFGDLHPVRRQAVRTRRSSSARRVDSVAYEVTTFALNSARVPVLPVRLVSGGDTTVVGSPPRTVPVVSVVGPDAKALRTPAALAHFPRPAWVWGLLGLFTAAVLGGGAYGWWRWRTQDATGTDDPEPERAYEAASAQLRRLERRHPSGHEAAKAFYVDLTEALRVYLVRRVGVPALEQTTAEVVAALRRRPEVQEETIQRLQAVLEQADLVKFADAQPPPAESRSVLGDAQDALDALEATRRREEARATDDASSSA